MAKRLTDLKKKKIIADYVECGNYSAVARKHKVSKDTVRRLARQKDIVQKAQEKKEQNTKDMLEYMDSKKRDAMKFIDLAIDEMMKPEKLKRASVQALATSVGIIVDKFSPKDEKKENNLDLFKSITETSGNKFEKAD